MADLLGYAVQGPDCVRGVVQVGLCDAFFQAKAGRSWECLKLQLAD